MTDSQLGSVGIDRYYRPHGLRLTLHLDGATPQDIERGINAAKRVFLLANVSSYAAAVAVFYQDVEDPEVALTPEQQDWGGLWREAEEAAVQAACSEMSPGRKTFLFSQTWDDEAQIEPSKFLQGWIDWPGR